MRYRRGLFPILIVLAASGYAAAPAAATTYCVNTTATDCDPQPFGDVATALAAADANAGHDTVRIGAGTFTGTGAAHADVDIIGAGKGATILTGPAGVPVLTLGTASTVANLTLAIPPGNNGRGLVAERGKAENVAVTGPAEATNAIGFRSTDSGTLELAGVAVTLPGPGTTAVSADVGDLIVRESSLTAARGITPAANESLKVSSAAINAGIGILGGGGFISAENALIIVIGAGSRGIVVSGGVPLAGSRNGVMEASNLTIVGTGAANSIGVDIAGTAGIGSAVRNADVTISSSIIRGTAVSVRRRGDAPDPGQTGGDAKLTIRYSLLGAVADEAGPPGNADVSTGNISGNPDPLFSNPLALDFTPKAGSPLIDAGDPAALQPGESSVDIAGRPRVVNGRRDIGAYEYQAVTPPAPPDKVGPKVGIATKSARLTRDGRLRIKLTCPKAETRGCKGGLTANSAKKLKLTKRSKSKILRLGSSNFATIAAGKSKVVSIKVSKTARGVIRKRRKLSVKLTAAARDRAKNLGKNTRTITVRPPA